MIGQAGNVSAVGRSSAAAPLAKARCDTSPFAPVALRKAEARSMETESLPPAAELARDNPVRIPNESAEYRAARTTLLAKEIELRRHIERVAAQRRSLPPGGQVIGDYRFEGEDGASDFTGLFGDKQTLAVYSYMFGPQRERPCPMCTNLLGA